MSPSIKETFGINVHVYPHPVNGLPVMLVTPADINDTSK